jgi:hypothetical protein
MMGLRALSRQLSPTLTKQGESRLSSYLKKRNSTAETKCKSGRVNKIAERSAIIGAHFFTVKLLRAQNPKRQTPGAGRRVQSGAQPDEASNRLTRRPATYNRIPIHAHATRNRTTERLF